MAYAAARRRSILARLGSWIASALAGAAVWWFVFFNIRPTGTFEGWLSFIVGLLACLVIGIVLHESGHLVMGLAGGEPVRMIRIGSGPTVLGLRVRAVTVQLCLNPITGGAVYFSRITSAPRAMHLASLAAGPGVNLLAAIYGFAFYQSGVSWLGPFVLANLVLFVGSATPSTATEGGREQRSDGMQILDLLLRPAVPLTNYDGAQMTKDAYAVLARAGEDAQLSGANEVTDEDLLRALNQDAVVGRLFASVGLSPRIPQSQPPDSDDPSSPRVSKVASAALAAACQKCRDLGIQKPNAAGFCLGLLVVDCPAGRLMKEAGITEEAVRKLATVTTEDEEDLRRARVITADLPVERWGTAADRILAQAIRTAVADRSPFVGTQHLVAAIVADPQCRGAQALDRLGFVLVWKKESDEAGVETAREGAPVLSPQAGLAIGGALWRTGPTYPTGTAELCLGILDQSAGIGAQLLLSAGVTVKAMEKALRFTSREASEPAGCTESSMGMWMLRGNARVGAERW